jgi:hypothetical protein
VNTSSGRLRPSLGSNDSVSESDGGSIFVGGGGSTFVCVRGAVGANNSGGGPESVESDRAGDGERPTRGDAAK